MPNIFLMLRQVCQICDDLMPGARATTKHCRPCRNIASQIRVSEWKVRHPERAKALEMQIRVKYLSKHRLKINQRLRDRYNKDPEKWCKYACDWAKKPENAKKIRNRFRKRYATDPLFRLKCSAYGREREARKRNATIGNIKPLLALLASKKSVPCYYCNEITLIKDIHLDHLRPLIKGGAHAAFNLVPACRTCNCHKQGQHPNRFIKKGQLLLVY